MASARSMRLAKVSVSPPPPRSSGRSRSARSMTSTAASVLVWTRLRNQRPTVGPMRSSRTLAMMTARCPSSLIASLLRQGCYQGGHLGLGQDRAEVGTEQLGELVIGEATLIRRPAGPDDAVLAAEQLPDRRGVLSHDDRTLHERGVRVRRGVV